MKFNPYRAPKGYIAVEAIDAGCTGCAFESERACGKDRPCMRDQRPDNTKAIFKKIEEKNVAKPIKNDVKIFVVQHHEMYSRLCGSLYDMMQDGSHVESITLTSMFDPLDLIARFRDGYTCLYVPQLMVEIEELDKNDKPYVIVVMKDGKLFAAIGSNYVEY